MRGHADAATLAAFREELLSARKAAQVSAHLAACPRCAALEAQLAEVTTLLNHASAPPMPDALTARIQAALAAEAAARTTADAPHAALAPEAVPAMQGAAGYDGAQGTNGHRAGDGPGRRPGRRGHGRSWLALRVAAVTAAVAVVAGGGYGVAQLLTRGGPILHGAASGTGAAPAVRVTSPVMGPSAGGLNEGPGSPSGTGRTAHSSTRATLVLSSGTNYEPSRLAAQASALLARQNTSSSSAARPLPVAPAQRQAALFPHLQACLIHVGKGQHPLLVDLARYQGHPALIVVLPPTNGGQPEALAVAPGCNSTTARVLTTVPLPSSSS